MRAPPGGLERAMMKFAAKLALLPLAALALGPAGAREAPPQAFSVEGYSDLADLTLGAPAILRGTVTKADRLSAKDAPDVSPGRVRVLVEASVQAAIAAPSAVAPVVKYLWETKADAKGKPPKLKGAAVLLFARPVSGREDQILLTGPNSQIAATASAEATVRRILTEARDPELRTFRVTGIANAFHVPGSIPGEAETQIFLATATQRPVSLVVLSRPGQPKSYSLATGDVIDEAAKPIPPQTLLWYRLACTLPSALPAGVAGGPDAASQAATAEDYRFVVDSLGKCGRTLRTN